MQNLSQPFPKTSASFEQQKKQGNQQTRQGASCIKTRKGRLHIIRVIAAEISDTGAECALDALEGAIGGGGNRIGK